MLDEASGIMPDAKPLIALNLKAYPESSGAAGLTLCRIAKDVADASGVRIIVCPDATLVREAAKAGADVFAQECGPVEPGARTGWTTALQLKEAGARGSLLNHSEHRIPHEQVGKALERLGENGLQAMVCAQDASEAAQLACFEPAFVAVEPPELIGSGISVSTAKPEVVEAAVEAIAIASSRVVPVCGAGVSTPGDVKKAFELGARGVLLASAYVKAKEPRKLLEEMAAQAR